MYNFIVNKLSSHFTKITMFNLSKNYGHSIYSISNNEAVLHYLFINQKFRGNDLGSVLLNKSEDLILQNHNINKISLLAHEKQGTNSLSNFYLKNGYFEDFNKKSNYYDDGSEIYSLIPFYKKIN